MTQDTPNPDGKVPSNDLLTAAQTAESLGVRTTSLAHYRNLRRKGVDKGPEFVKVGRSVRYRPADVRGYAQRRGR